MPNLPALDEECFFIAPIGAEGSPERKRSDGVLDFIVGRSAQEVGLTAVRADRIAEPGQITLQVIEHVLGARAAVVDLTGLNPNVFYELAIRHTARLPVALIAEKDTSLPFDIAQMRTIFFDHTDLQSADQCRRDITSHLREALNGSVDSPITTTLDVRTLQAGSVVERNVAELVTTVEEMAKSQRASLDMIERLRVDVRRGSDTWPEFAPQAMNDITRGLERLRQIAAKSEDGDVKGVLRDIDPPMAYLERELGLGFRPNERTFTRRSPSRKLEQERSSEEPGPQLLGDADGA